MDTPNLVRRRIMIAGVGAALGTVNVRAEERYPLRPVSLLVGFAPGGQSDILARKMATHLEQMLGAPFVVKNVPGAASTMSLRQLASAKPDGYTLAVTGGSGMVMAPLIMSVPYSVASFKTVGMLTSAGGAIAVHPSVPAKNLAELVKLIKQDPQKFSYAHSGTGGIDHMTGELFKKTAGGLNLVDIPFSGSAPAIQAVVAGQVPILSATFSSTYKFHQAGQLRVIAITSSKRSELAPEVKTAREQGFADLVAETYNLLIAPDHIPDTRLGKLRVAVSKIMARPQVTDDLKAMGFEPVSGMSPAATDAFLATETKKWKKVVEEANISIK